MTTRFEEELKAKATMTARPEPPPYPTDAVPGSLRVLVVEDDVDALAVTLDLLKALGHWAAGVKSAEAAISRFFEGAFDVLMTDIGLPGLSGRQLVEKLQPGPDLPVIFATGEPEPPARIPGTVWLQKPYTIEQLNQALAAASKLSDTKKRKNDYR